MIRVAGEISHCNKPSVCSLNFFLVCVTTQCGCSRCVVSPLPCNTDPGFPYIVTLPISCSSIRIGAQRRAYTLFKSLGPEAIDLTSPALVKRVTPLGVKGD